MKVFKTRPGVVLTEIAGEYVLVSAKALQGICPYVTQINESSAFLWRRLEHGAGLAQLEAAVAEEYEVEDPASLREAIESFLQQMQGANYLLSEEMEEGK